MKKLFYIGVYLNERILWKNYGFTSYADLFTEAETPEEAKQFAKQYFEDRFKIKVAAMKATTAKREFVNPSEIIKPILTGIQSNIFQVTNTSLK